MNPAPARLYRVGNGLKHLSRRDGTLLTDGFNRRTKRRAKKSAPSLCGEGTLKTNRGTKKQTRVSYLQLNEPEK